MKKLIQNKVDKKTIATFPTVIFPGRIVVVLSATEAERAVDYLLSQPVLGFDTETRPSFKKGVHHKCSLLQVSTANCCFLFRLNYIGMCPAIKRVWRENKQAPAAYQLGARRAGGAAETLCRYRRMGLCATV